MTGERQEARTTAAPAKTAAERKQAERLRRKAEGLEEVRGIWAPSALHKRVKEWAARLVKKEVK